MVRNSDAVIARIVYDDATQEVRVDAVLNSASLLAGPVVPGESITIRGSGFRPDARVLLRREPLAVVSVEADEIQAVAPETLEPGGGVELRVESGGQASNPVLVNTALFSPAVFTQDGSGRGPALVFNEDETLNSRGLPQTGAR